MKGKPFFIAAATLAVILATLACGPLTPKPSTPTAAPTATNPVTPTEPELPPIPTSGAGAPQPAAPAYFSPGAKIKLTQVKMFGTDKGWGLVGFFVLVTSDGGRTWKEVTPPQTFSSPDNAKAYAAFPDDHTAWVVFAENDHIPPEVVVWSTTDRGQTWRPSAPLMHGAYGDSVWGEFAASSAPSGWLMIRGVYAGAGTHYAAQIFHTTDNGLSWVSIPGGDIGVDYTSFVFANAMNGWLAWQTTGAYGAAPPEYAVTSDGGVNWTSLTLPPPVNAPSLFTDYEYSEPYQVNLLSASSVRLLVAAFGYGFPPTKFTGYLYKTEDGGSTWQTSPLPSGVLASDYTLIFFDADNGLLLGRESYRTADGGNTWQHVSTVYWDGQYSFVDKLNGWAIATLGSEASLVRTTNGGTTWIILETTIAP